MQRLRHLHRPIGWLALCLAGVLFDPPARAASPEPTLVLQPCRLKGVEHEARCGVLRRPLDPARADGTQIDLHVAVLPAVARHRKPDAVFFLAGGPGQSAISLAGSVGNLLARFRNRRDVVLVDQRGTGLSAPLRCDDDAPTRSLRDSSDPAQQQAEMAACRERLEKLAWGDLRQYTTTIAMADLEAVRLALGLGPVNLIGGSYGTRAGLEYMRLYPGSVRRAVLDGVAPPDMALPMSFSTDAQSALDALLADCEQAPGCHQAFPRLRSQWQAVLAGLPKAVTVQHPLTGRDERLTLTREMLVGLVRLPLYAPVLAAGLPAAISEAAEGRFGPLVSLSSGVLPGRAQGLAAGMHFSVVCAEDMSRLASSQDKAGADFGEATLAMYRRVCQGWPQAPVDAAFYTMPATPAGTLLLSGSLDPVTPPRHGERAARALGPQALHLSVPNVGHGVIASVPCMRDAVFRFIDNESQADALAQARADGACAARLPRPPAVRALADRQEPAAGARP